MSHLQILIACLVGLSTLFTIAFSLGKRSAAVYITKDELNKNCNIKHGFIENKITFMQYLLLELSTQEQQDAAKNKMKSFQGLNNG